MKLYAAQASRAGRQAMYDALTLAWVSAWVWLGVQVHAQVSGSEDGARRIERNSGELARQLHDAADVLAHTPLIGAKVRRPVDKSGDAAAGLQHAGRQLADNLGKLGAAVGVEVALVPVLVAVAGWLVLRLGYARRAGRADALRRLPGGADLLALEALRRLPPARLASLADDPVHAWRTGEPEAITALAAAYLDSLGLRGVSVTQD